VFSLSLSAIFLIGHSFYQPTLTRVHADYLPSKDSPYDFSAHPKLCTCQKVSFFFLLNVSAYFAVAQLHMRQTLGSHPHPRDGFSDCSIFGFPWIIEIKIGSMPEIA
jgi:hypothetical protein